MTRRAAAAALGALVAASALAAAPSARPEVVAQPSDGAERLVLVAQATHPHDRTAYTQGLLLHDGALFESTGKYGFSTLREVDPATGDARRSIALPAEVFAEGLALVDDRLVQLTWREGRALRWDRATFASLGEHAYDGEGWGLCHDGERLVMSDGSPVLTFRDPETFDALGGVTVRLEGVAVMNLNELECVGDDVYANVWRETRILRIDPATGDVTAVIDASALDADLRARYDLPDPYDCLNGIAHIPGTDRFYVTGKHWPELYEARFLPVADATATAAATSAGPTATATATSGPTATPEPAFLPLGWTGRR